LSNYEHLFDREAAQCSQAITERGITTVALDENGGIVEHRPAGGSQRPASRRRRHRVLRRRSRVL